MGGGQTLSAEQITLSLWDLLWLVPRLGEQDIINKTKAYKPILIVPQNEFIIPEKPNLRDCVLLLLWIDFTDLDLNCLRKPKHKVVVAEMVL